MLTVVLPVFNEEGNIKPLHNELTAALDGFCKEYELIFVDDGSEDESLEELKEIREANSNVKLIEFRSNFGQSAALQAGFDHAKGEYVIAMDSDMQNDPKDIPKLLDKLDEGYDCVSGWRNERDDPLMKRAASRFASFLQKPFLGKEVHDYGCTLKAYRKEALDDIKIHGELHRYIPPLLKWKGYRVAELKVNHRERHSGETKYGPVRLIKGFLDLLVVWFWQKFSQRPIHIFGGLGLVFGLFGGATGVYMAYRKIFEGVNLSSHFLSTISFFSIVMGIQLFTSGVIADIGLKNYRDNHDDTYNVRKVHG